MQTISTHFERELRSSVERRMQHILDVLTGGQLPDFASYQYQVGKYHALREVLVECCEEVNTELSKTL